MSRRATERVQFYFLLFCLFTLYALSSRADGPSPGTKILYDVPLVRQSTSYSCGAAALQSVLAFYGIEYMETEVMKAVRTKRVIGTWSDAMADFAFENELAAENRQNLTLDDLRRNISLGHPVIVEIQAWPDDPISDYTDIWTEGHYVVVIGVDERNIYFVDPSILGGRGFIPIAEFLTRWHEIGRRGEHLSHTGILFSGPIKAPPQWQHIP
ncbi:MAG: C39 family peptidase [Deltaproteobacteria bacterium]|nr:C39 family peptidase [Deltaproteobacteria bacterium]